MLIKTYLHNDHILSEMEESLEENQGLSKEKAKLVAPKVMKFGYEVEFLFDADLETGEITLLKVNNRSVEILPKHSCVAPNDG
jgi:hypothetical protein